MHVGCFEVFAHEGIRSIADLKGKSVGIPYSSSAPHTFLTIMTSYIGLDPSKDINWVITSPVQPKQLFIDRKIDAILTFHFGQLEQLFMNRGICGIWQWLTRSLASLTMLGVALTTR